VQLELTTTTLAIFAVVAAMGLIGVVAVQILSVPEDAEARGCNNSVAANASKGRCIRA
jgi:hypothetical protein